MTNPYKAEFVLTPGQAVQQAGDTAAIYLARAVRHVAECADAPLNYPEIIAAVIQAQAFDYFAWVMSDRLTYIGDQLQAGAGREIAEAVTTIAEELAAEFRVRCEENKL